MVFFSLLPYTTISDAICRLTENRTLHPPAHGKPHSAPTMPPRRDQGRILDGRRHGKAHFAVLLAHYMPVAKAAEMAATLVSTGVQGLASRRKAQVRSPAARQGARTRQTTRSTRLMGLMYFMLFMRLMYLMLTV